MNTEQIMALADAYAAATSEHVISGASDADRARAALEAALTEKQEPYDKTEMNAFVQNLYDQKTREGKHGHYETMFHVVHQAIKRAHPAPVNQQLLEALKLSLEAMEYADACLKKQLTTKTKHEYAQDLLMDAGTKARAAIAAAEGKV